ncbi:hypothetical protein [Streptomyces sp. NPDC056361]|uniref:hypothetical protein n=1 Tax=Streptomyces sp. NPDC056361 TaxID=3345795 RepID=UPI0035D9B267
MYLLAGTRVADLSSARIAPDPKAFAASPPAAARDADFLWCILLEAYNWNGEERFTVEQPAAEPRAAHYLVGWPRRDDFEFIAETSAGEPIGAAWARCLSESEPGYGFVAPQLPS